MGNKKRGSKGKMQAIGGSVESVPNSLATGEPVLDKHSVTEQVDLENNPRQVLLADSQTATTENSTLAEGSVFKSLFLCCLDRK